MEGETDPNRGGLYYCNNHFKIILTKFIKIDMMAVQASEKRMRSMIITKETDYALRILRVLLDGVDISSVFWISISLLFSKK